jgi:hypothetical protein
MLNGVIGYIKVLFLKIVCHDFWPGLIPLPKSMFTYFGFILISCGCHTSPAFFSFFFCNEPIWFTHHKKKVETMESPQNWRFYGKMECLPLCTSYIGEKGRTLGKTYGIKTRCYWKHPWGTHWEPREHSGNLMGTKEKEKSRPHPTPQPKTF